MDSPGGLAGLPMETTVQGQAQPESSLGECAWKSLGIVMMMGCFMFLQLHGWSPGTSVFILGSAAIIAEMLSYRYRCVRPDKQTNVLIPADMLSSAEHGATKKSLKSGSPSVECDTSSTLLQSPDKTCETCSAGQRQSTVSHAVLGGVHDSVEQAITRLAGAAELGTEPVIYVRRKDVTHVIDYFIELAQKAGNRNGDLPILARLAIMRRANARDYRRSRRPSLSPEGHLHRRRRSPPRYRANGNVLHFRQTSPERRCAAQTATSRRSLSEGSEGRFARKRTKAELRRSDAGLLASHGVQEAASSPVKREQDGRDAERPYGQSGSGSLAGARPRSSRIPLALALESLQDISKEDVPVIGTTEASFTEGRAMINRVAASPPCEGRDGPFQDFWTSGLY